MISDSLLSFRRGSLALLCSTVAFCMAVAAQAQTPLDFASMDGNATTQTAAYGITPSAGTTQLLLTTVNPAATLPADGSLGTIPAADAGALNTYFGFADGTLAGLSAQDGSGALSNQVALTAGSIVSFDYIFLTDEDNTLPTTPAPSQYHDDRSFFTVNGVINQTLYTAGDLSEAQLNNGSNSANFDFQSPGTAANGYETVTYTVPTTGMYTFGFGVVDVDTNTIYSGLLIDNVTVTVPEPSTWTLGLMGVSLLLLIARRNGLRVG